MELLTQCPKCLTKFPATLEQLQRRKGYIRCVQCAHIFDGFDAALDDDTNTPYEPKPEVKADNVPQVVRPRARTHIIPDIPHQIDDDPFIIPDTDPSKTDVKEPVFTESAVHHINDEAPIAASHEPVTSQHSTEYINRGGALAYYGWVTLIALACATLLIQLVFVFRVQIAEAIPAVRPGLERLCEPFKCEVAWSRKPEHILVTQSALQSDPSEDEDSTASKVLLKFTLRNTYNMPQEWPTVVLDLSDAAGARIARKNLPAELWLPTELKGKPFPASSEYSMELPLTLQGLKVNGYQLTTFFP